MYEIQTFILLFKGFPLFGPDFFFFFFSKYPYTQGLSRSKIKIHSGKNTILTPTKSLPTK